MIRSIAHPTDFSPAGQAAFEHALALALANRCPLDLLHVHNPRADEDWDRFPHVRDVLQRWEKLPPRARIADVAAVAGIDVRKVEIRDAAPGDGLVRFLHDHRPDLIVLASHGRSGPSRWLSPSVSIGVARETILPTLILGPHARPFVDGSTGRIALGSALMPVDHAPSAQAAVPLLERLLGNLEVTIECLHVGPTAPVLRDRQGVPIMVHRADGPVIETLLEYASRARLIAMPMAARRGLIDLLRGSTTDRVVAEASCPVLALPEGE